MSGPRAGGGLALCAAVLTLGACRGGAEQAPEGDAAATAPIASITLADPVRVPVVPGDGRRDERDAARPEVGTVGVDGAGVDEAKRARLSSGFQRCYRVASEHAGHTTIGTLELVVTAAVPAGARVVAEQVNGVEGTLASCVAARAMAEDWSELRSGEMRRLAVRFGGRE